MEEGFRRSGQLIFRRVEDQDYPSIALVFNENIRLGDATLWEQTFSADDIKTEVEQYSDREGMYVLDLSGIVIGFATIKHYHPKRGYAYTCDTSVFLSREHTGQGYGSRFKRFILDECKRLDYHHVVAKILATNTRSINYNLKLGYSIVGTQKEVGKRGDQWVDVVILQYLIDPKHEELYQN